MTESRPVRLALIQHACGPDPNRNLSTTIDMIRSAADQGAQIIATQELFHLPYFPQTCCADHFKLAETIPGPMTQRLCELAAGLNVLIVASLFEQRTTGVYHNTAVMIDGTTDSFGRTGGRIIGKYRKMHIPDDPGYYEKYYFTPGDYHAADDRNGQVNGWITQQTPYATTGILICWDQWFPEAARLAALRGAQILFYPTAIARSEHESPEQQERQKEAWQVVQRAHAITNGLFVATINRVGVENRLCFWGGSFVSDPTGRIIAQAGTQEQQILIADCDLSRIADWRHEWPFLRDRRVDAYGDLARRYVD